MKRNILYGALILTLAACVNSLAVNPAYQTGEQNGKPVYTVPVESNNFTPSYRKAGEEKAIIRAYCGTSGGTILSRGPKVDTGRSGIFTNFGVPMQSPIYTHDLEFVCK